MRASNEDERGRGEVREVAGGLGYGREGYCPTASPASPADARLAGPSGATVRSRSARSWGVAAAVALSASLLSACSSDADSPADTDSSGGAVVASDAPAAGTSAAPAGDDANETDSNDDSADGAGPASATVQWDGETYELDDVRCTNEELAARYTMIANGADAPTLQVAIEYDPLADEPDVSQPSEVNIFFTGEGGTIGDGEGYSTPYGPVAGATSSENGASGSVQLEPEDGTRGAEVNPDGGQLDFELTCG